MKDYSILITEENKGAIKSILKLASLSFAPVVGQYLNHHASESAHLTSKSVSVELSLDVWPAPDYPVITDAEFYKINSPYIQMAGRGHRKNITAQQVTEQQLYDMLNNECRESGAINPHKAAKEIYKMISSGNQYCLFNTENGRYYSGEYWLEVPVWSDLAEVLKWAEQVSEKTIVALKL